MDELIRIAHSSKKFVKIREVKFILNHQFRSLVVRVRSKFYNLGFINFGSGEILELSNEVRLLQEEVQKSLSKDHHRKEK